MDFGRFILFPVLLTQGLWVASRALQLPDPDGPRSGIVGQGPRLKLLIVGDSSALGVGVSHQDHALSGRTIARLADNFEVHWKVIAKTGATAEDTVKRLQASDAEAFDVVVTALGVNDAKNCVRSATWQSSYAAIFDILQSRFSAGRIIACGLPPIHDFPLLPFPLRSILAQRAAHFENLLRDCVAQHETVTFLPMPKTLNPAHMAADGFHAGPLIYDEWASHLAPLIFKMTEDFSSF